MTQDSLSKKADIPYTTLAKIESNVILSPTLPTVTKIAEGLDITIDELQIVDDFKSTTTDIESLNQIEFEL